MKRIVCLILISLMLLTGCSGKENVNFYYCRKEFQYDVQDSVIVSEPRDISGHTGQLPFLISLYLMGPLESDYTSPFSSRTKLIAAHMDGNHLTVELTESGNLSDVEYSLACACMALTCMELTDAVDVTVTMGNRTLTLSPDILTIYDAGVPADTTGG